MKVISYKEFVVICKTVVESCTGYDTEGAIYDRGHQLMIEFGVDDICITVFLKYDEPSGYWDTDVRFIAEFDYGYDDNAQAALKITDRIKHTLAELSDILSGYLIDYGPAYKEGKFWQYEWKLPAYGEK